MAKAYVEYRFSIHPKSPWEEILLAELQELPFESFLETENGFNAYVSLDDHKENFLESIDLLHSNEVEVRFTTSEIAPENWNAKWESNFHPIFVGDTCVIRAEFHEKHGKLYEVIINPKMSFGTGHHPTTHMMMEFVLEETLVDKTILDMGCGTGVLGILASKKGALQVDAIDNDPWCVENSIENAQSNNCKNFLAKRADSLKTNNSTYDFIFANINRNILLEQVASYADGLIVGGSLFLSGFYKDDVEVLRESCQNLNLTLVSIKERESWCALKFIK
jgi:ribosomal protein L11 methyltransferase